jgi:hypothetical protein
MFSLGTLWIHAQRNSVLQYHPPKTTILQAKLEKLFLSSITYLPPTTSRKTLGCYKSPSGYYKKSLETITAKVTEKTALIANSSFDSKCTLQSYYSILLPSITYPLSTTNIPEKVFIKLQ